MLRAFAHRTAAILALAACPSLAACQTPAAAPPPPPATTLPVPVPSEFDRRQDAVQPALDAKWRKLPTAEQVRLIASQQNAILLSRGIFMYAQDHDLTFPTLKSLGQTKHAMMPYLQAESGYQSASADSSFQTNFHLSDRKMSAVGSPATTLVIYSKFPDAFGYRVVSFAGGCVEIVSQSEWKALQAGKFQP